MGRLREPAVGVVHVRGEGLAQIERPSLLFIKVDENVELDVQLKLRAGK